MDGMRNEDRDYSVTAIHFPCLDDRAELESEALESGGLSSDSGHALLGWMTDEGEPVTSPLQASISSAVLLFTSRA